MASVSMKSRILIHRAEGTPHRKMRPPTNHVDVCRDSLRAVETSRPGNVQLQSFELHKFIEQGYPVKGDRVVFDVLFLPLEVLCGGNAV